MRTATVALIGALSVGLAFAKLPPPTGEAMAQAAESAAKAAWATSRALPTVRRNGADGRRISKEH